MSTPYWHCGDCGQNTEISEKVLKAFRRKEGSLNDLMTCKHCESSPESRRIRNEAKRSVMKKHMATIKRKPTPFENYERWWKGKLCRVSRHDEFKRVKEVKFISNPSQFSGTGFLIFEDGTEENIGTSLNAYKPRKKDVEVLEE